MTVPLTPADLDKLEQQILEYPRVVLSRERATELIADALGAIPALLAAARERDALLTAVNDADHRRQHYAGSVRHAEKERDEANALLEDCAGQFLMSDDDGTVHHSFMSTEEALCRHLVKIGSLVREGDDHFRWAEQKTTTPTGQEKPL